MTSPAERQRRYRARKRAERDAVTPVTGDAVTPEEDGGGALAALVALAELPEVQACRYCRPVLRTAVELVAGTTLTAAALVAVRGAVGEVRMCDHRGVGPAWLDPADELARRRRQDLANIRAAEALAQQSPAP